MNKTGLNSVNTNPAVSTPSGHSDEQNPGQLNGQEVTSTDLPAQLNSPKSKVGQPLQPSSLMHRTVDSIEEGMMNLIKAVEGSENSVDKAVQPDVTEINTSDNPPEPLNKENTQKNKPLKVQQDKQTTLSALLETFAGKVLKKSGLIPSKKTLKDAKKAFDVVDKQVKSTESSIVKLTKEIHSLTQKLKTSRFFVETKNKWLEKKKAQLEQHTNQLPSLKKEASLRLDTLTQTEEAFERASKDSQAFIKPVTRFLASIRESYQNQIQNKPDKGQPSSLFQIPIQHLTLNVPGSLLNLKDANLSIAGIHFVKGPRGKMCPILSISDLTATIDMTLPDNEVVNSKLTVKGIKAGLAGSVGQLLHNYITAPNALTAGMGLLKEITHINDRPDLVALNADDIDIELPELAPTTVASFIKKMKSSPGSTIDRLFTSLNHRLSTRLKHIAIKTGGQVSANSDASEVAIDYRPRLPADDTSLSLKPGATPRKLTVECGHIHAGINNTAQTVNRIQHLLTPSSPLKHWLQSESPEKPDFTQHRQASLSTQTECTASHVTVNVTREVEQVDTPDARLTGGNRIHAEAESFAVSNKGAVQGEAKANAIVADIQTTDGEPVRLSSGNTRLFPDLDARIHMNSTNIHLEAPTALTLPLTTQSDETYLKGAVTLSTQEPTECHLEKKGKDLAVTGKLPELQADITQPFTASKHGTGVHIPTGQLQLQGELSVASNPSVTTYHPSLTMTSDNTLQLLTKKHQIPLDLNARLTLHKTTPKVFVSDPEKTGHLTVSPVLSNGDFTFDLPKAGPVRLGQVKAVFNGEDYGAIHLPEVSINLNEVSEYLYPHSRSDRLSEHLRLTLPKKLSNPLIKWALKRAMKNRRLNIEAQLKVVDGAIDLNQLETLKFHYSSRSHGVLDRFITRGLNTLTRRYIKKLLTFTLSIETPKPESPEGQGNNKKSKVKTKPSAQHIQKPTVILRLPHPFNVSFPLPLPVDCVNTHARTLSMSSLLMQETGALMVSSHHVTSVEQALEQIQAGKWEGIKRLITMLELYANKPSHLGLVHLIARQFPVKTVKQQFKQQPDLQAALTPRLKQCASQLLNHPHLCLEAANISRLTDAPLEKEHVERRLKQAMDNPSMNPAGLGVLSEKSHHDDTLAENCYQLAINRNVSPAFAHRRLGKLLVEHQGEAFDLDRLRRGFNHLINACQLGHSEVLRDLEKLEAYSSTTLKPAHSELIRKEAGLALATVLLEQDKNHQDFEQALKRLTVLAIEQDETRLQNQAIDLLIQRIQNGSLSFHTSDLNQFNESQERLQRGRQCLESLNINGLKPIAKTLGIHCLYGSHGIVQNIDLARQFLLVASSTEDREAGFHLGIAQKAMPNRPWKDHPRLVRAIAAASPP